MVNMRRPLQKIFGALLCIAVIAWTSKSFLANESVVVVEQNNESNAPRPVSLDTEQHKLLTFFITLKDISQKKTIHVHTLKQLSSLARWAHLILFVTDKTNSSWNRLATDLHWDVRSMNRTKKDLPILKWMYLTALANYETRFYAYANADLLFDQSLTRTLDYLSTISSRLSKPGLFITGMRTNVPIRNVDEALIGRSDLSALKKLGHVFSGYAEDYFITTRDGFPWSSIPDLVVGRPGYDNWLVATARSLNLTVVDVTRTVLAVHQTGVDGDFAGNAKISDRSLNYWAVGTHFNYSKGQVQCAPWFTQLDSSQGVKLVRRRKNFYKC